MHVLVRGFLKAKAKGPGALQVFINTQLGEWWDPRDGDALQVEGLLARRESYPMTTLPAGVVLIVAAVDIQDDRLELLVMGIGPGEETWLLDYRQIHGNLATHDPWDRLEEALRRDWEGLRVRACGMDIGGHFTRQAYQFAKRPALKGLVFPLKGATKPQQKLTRRSSAKARLWLVDTVAAKDQILGRLKIAQPGPGYMHFPQDLDGTYFEMLLAERPIRKAGRRAYEKITEDARNEALDLTVYALAALEIYGPRDLEALAKTTRPRQQPREQEVIVVQPSEDERPRRAPRFPKNRGGTPGW
jgi:phage terminase large subunit GpA-like protein